MRSRSVVLVSFLSCVSLVPASGSLPARTSDAEVQVGREVKIRTFAFGGVGIAGVISEGEKYFFTILFSSGARGFRELFERGDAQSKAYALVGLRWFSDSRYNRLRDAFVAQGSKVVTMDGCIMHDEDAEALVSRIDARTWDDYITVVVRRKKG